MANNNQEFLNAYNRLDNYLKSITGAPERINLISYLERILSEKERSELKTIRGYKNTIESHGVIPGGQKPIVPRVWTLWLERKLQYCRQNNKAIATKLNELLKSSNNGGKYGYKQNGKYKPDNKRSGKVLIRLGNCITVDGVIFKKYNVQLDINNDTGCKFVSASATLEFEDGKSIKKNDLHQGANVLSFSSRYMKYDLYSVSVYAVVMDNYGNKQEFVEKKYFERKIHLDC